MIGSPWQPRSLSKCPLIEEELDCHQAEFPRKESEDCLQQDVGETPRWKPRAVTGSRREGHMRDCANQGAGREGTDLREVKLRRGGKAVVREWVLGSPKRLDLGQAGDSCLRGQWKAAGCSRGHWPWRRADGPLGNWSEGGGASMGNLRHDHRDHYHKRHNYHYHCYSHCHGICH